MLLHHHYHLYYDEEEVHHRVYLLSEKYMLTKYRKEICRVVEGRGTSALSSLHFRAMMPVTFGDLTPKS